MNKNLILAIVLGILVIVSVVQAFQLSSLKAKVGGAGVSTVSAPASVSAPSSGGASVPSSLQNLPQMVGGC